MLSSDSQLANAITIPDIKTQTSKLELEMEITLCESCGSETLTGKTGLKVR